VPALTAIRDAERVFAILSDARREAMRTAFTPTNPHA
jgi:hypothetical protein